GVGDAVDHLGAGARQINALITEAELLGEHGRHLRYRLVLRPWLHLATLNAECRIFQNATVVDILDALLANYPFPVDKRLAETFPIRDYQTQFNESDFAFFERLCQEWGISYHFEHDAGAHRLVLSDHLGAFGPNPSEAYRQVAYHPPGWKLDAEYLHAFMPASRITSGRYSSREYDYTRPRADLSVSRSDPRPTGFAEAEVYAWHASLGGSHYAQPRAGTAGPNDPLVEGDLIARLRMQQLRTAGARARASGNLRGMVPGFSFTLQGHPREAANAEYLILETEFLIEDVGQDSQAALAAGTTVARPQAQQRWQVQVDLLAHPITEPLRPALTRIKPHTHGPQTARVVGPEGQELWTDELGRIKVQFPWDRQGQENPYSSCWVRVASPWAGNQLGGVHLPRIGQEVIVDFLGGDPDLPLCTGRVHNQLNLPPWQLPQQSALSGFRSRELTDGGGNSAAGRSNHLVMDDTAGQIQTQLKSDHQHSSLSLGAITRIEDHQGRKDARGEGFELRTDGHGVLRAQDGMLITTEGRANAVEHAKSMGETVARLKAATRQHEGLADAASIAKAQERGADQDAVAQRLARQASDIQGEGQADAAQRCFPELQSPHLVLASAAGLAATTAQSLHLQGGEHVALTSEGHTSLSVGRRWLVAAKQGLRVFARRAGMKWIVGEGPVRIQAQRDAVQALARQGVTIRSTTGSIVISAPVSVMVNGGGSFTEWSNAGITHGTPGTWVEHAASHVQMGPLSVDQHHGAPPPRRDVADSVPGKTATQRHFEEQFVLLEHASGLRLAQQRYRIVFDGGRTVEGVTNDAGETDVARSMVPQVASVELLRHSEDGVLARYAPTVYTPADQDYAPVSEKRERKAQAVGGKGLKPNADEATSQSKAPVYASCDPNNWGMRQHEPKGPSGQGDYPVARAYVEAVKPVLMRASWRNGTWPLNLKSMQSIQALFQIELPKALAKGAFGLPEDAMPRIRIPTDEEAQALGLTDFENVDLKGVMRPTDWLLVGYKGGLLSILAAANGGGDVGDAVREFASTLYHEARHAQQYFWMSALVQQHPLDYVHLPNIQLIWATLMPQEYREVAAKTPLPNEPSALVGLHRMVIAMYYQLLCYYDSANKKKPDRPGYLPDVLRTEIPLARKAAYELLQDVGLGGKPIDVDQMATAEPGSLGYRMRPWEEDSFACEEVVKHLWNGAPGAALPPPGFCTRLFDIASNSVRQPARGKESDDTR
ncbi:type VI secretion system Vgr family protein, partial [Pseudacidovorax sp. NFM-22]|uniref:type VI secretion system Vgr family protein n=1 Tax=Pseudacidovorax sp. NFM-22 TaxID=2744469 RepID=UPI001F17005E